MNERIRELALQAGIEFVLWDDSGRPMIANYTPEEYLDEFAELLFNEIANTAVIYDGYIDESRQLAVKLHLGDFRKRIPIIGD